MSTISRSWGCIQPFYRGLCDAFLVALAAMQPGVEADLVDAAFIAEFGMASSVYLAAWRGNWGIALVTVLVDELPIDFYQVDNPWLLDLVECRLSGGCSPGDTTCVQKTGFA